MLLGMKVGERGQVTIPKPLRDQLGLHPGSAMEFTPAGDYLVLRRRDDYAARIARWRGQGKGVLRRLGVASVDELIERLRGR